MHLKADFAFGGNFDELDVPPVRLGIEPDFIHYRLNFQKERALFDGRRRGPT